MASLGGVRFLLSRRWLLFAVVVALGAWGASLLGQWQFHRLDERRHENSLVARNLALPPAPIDDVLDVGRSADPDDEWRRVTVHGTWDDAHTVVLKYQTRDGGSGVDAVTPLVTDDGAAVMVDRGWMATDNSGASRPEIPDAGKGQVTVTGHVRLDATGDATRVDDLSTRALSSKQLAGPVGHDLYGGFLDLAHQSPEAAHPLAAPDLPDDTSEGPHFFYGLQWWFFGVLAVFGFFYFMYDEWRRGRAPQPSEAAEHAPVDGEHHSADE